MRKLLRRAAAGTLGLLVVLLLALLYVHRTGIPRYTPVKLDLRVEVTPARVARGKRIAAMVCGECHKDPLTERLTGKRMPDVPPQFGIAHSRNITQHTTRGIGAWSDGEIAYLLRTGVRRDGLYAPPYMVKLPHMADEDIASIIAFLRSDDPSVAAADVASVDSRPSLFAKVLCHTVMKPLPYPTAPIALPDPQDRVATGRYLATNLGCWSCHSADFAQQDDMHPERSKGFFGGGNQMLDANGQAIVTANITLDATGIGGWTEKQFVHAVKRGFRPDNKPLRYPMAAFLELEDDEVSAIYAYLKTVPKIQNAVARTPYPVVAGESGEAVYHKYACQSCHGETGLGLCDLRKGHDKHPSDAELIAFIKNPALTVPGSKMPAWEGVIEERDYAALVAYVRRLGREPYRTSATN